QAWEFTLKRPPNQKSRLAPKKVLRTPTASRMLRARKKIDHALEAALPGIYLPLYTMVTFTRIPYAKAAKRAQIQDAFVYAGLFLIAAILVAAMLSLLAT